MTTLSHKTIVSRCRTALALTLCALLAFAGCSAPGGETEGGAPSGEPQVTSTATDTFPVTVEHKFGTTTVPAEPSRVVVVGLTEQDILLELGIVPVATTEWYGGQPYAVWPWARDLLGDAEPVVLNTDDGFQFEKIASLDPDLIVGTNAGLNAEDYEKLSALAPTVASVAGSTPYFSSWQDQTKIIAAAVGRSAAGEELIASVDQAYAEARAAHPEFAGLTATYSQGGVSEGNLYVYPDGLNTDFLTELGFTITPGLEKYAPEAGSQALIAEENAYLLEADVILFATEEPAAVEELLSHSTIAALDAVKEHRTVYTDGTLAGAIYFLTPLSQKYVIAQLAPRLADAVAGEAPQSIDG